MVYKNIFCGNEIGALGFGTMRLPLIEGGKGGDIDQAQVDEMVSCAIKNGVNYFDTAWPYHESMSEYSIGKALSKYDRSQFYIADKFPGHQTMAEYDVEKIFASQLKKCQVEYFDYYLLHNINNGTIDTYLDPKHDLINRVYKLKEEGKIRHLGFSFHGDLECLERTLDLLGDKAEFCQIQLNYLDWTLQNAREKYELLADRGIPVVVMEPLRGGKLANIENIGNLQVLRPNETAASWSFRFLQSLPNVKVVLSGMSNLEQMEQNCAAYSERRGINEIEANALFNLAEKLKAAVPCTGCRYCCKDCPSQIDIPKLISLYNDFKVSPSVNISINLSSIPEENKPQSCIGCGQCEHACPQHIDVPSLMVKMTEAFKTLPSWEEICREREAAAMKFLKEN